MAAPAYGEQRPFSRSPAQTVYLAPRILGINAISARQTTNRVMPGR